MCDSEKNRLLRLKQVRLQSKEIAQNIRDRVSNEKQKQQERIKAKKVEEANKWQRRHFQEKGKQYAASLAFIGEAHMEAEKEKLLPAVPRKSIKRPIAARVTTASKTKTPGKGKNAKSKYIQTSPREEEIVISSDSDSTSTLVDEQQIISSTDSLDISLPPAPNSPRIETRKEIPIPKLPERINNYQENYCFSQVTNLIKKKCGLKEDHFESIPSKWGVQNIMETSPLRDLNRREYHPRPLENIVQPRKLLSEPLKESKFAAKVKRKKITESPRPMNPKVHYYDHPNRFHKTYDPPANAVTKAGPSRNENAFQNAREEVFRDKYSSEMRDVVERERNRVQNIRSTQALEKERMRRHYESLLGRVDELLSKEEAETENPREKLNSNENYVERSEDVSAALDAGSIFHGQKERPKDDDFDVDLMEILGKILNKLDENKVQIIEGIMSKQEKTEEKIEIAQTKEVGVQSQFSPPERDTSESTIDQVEIQTVGQADNVEVVTVKDPKKKPQIQIVINVKDGPKMNNLCGITEEAIQQADNEKRKRSVSHRNLSDTFGKKYPKTPEKKGKILIDTISSITSESSVSTAYHSPPSAVYNDICQFMRRIEQEGPPIKVSGRPDAQEKTLAVKKSDKQSILLRKYITKLLEMPRNDVDGLSVSSGTEVPTPNASVVNIPANVAEEPQKSLQMKEVPTKMVKKSKKSNVKIPTQPKEAVRDLPGESKTQEMNIPPKIAEKKDNLPKSMPLPIIQVPPNVQEPDVLRHKYADYTEKYMRRILKLSKLISEVRNEKNRLMTEKPHISSGSDNGQDTSTKYKDFPHKLVGESSTDMSSVSEMKSTSKEDGQLLGNNTNLTACRTIGLSKDSGISISRPVTSTEIRDSPEFRFIPLKRSEKAKVPTLDEAAGRKMLDAAKTGILKSTSHELSTITELDTSRIAGSSNVNNQTKVEVAFKDLKEAIERISNEIEYQRFPSFEEYVQRLAESLQDQSMAPNASGQEARLLEYFKDLSREMIFQKFPSYREFLQQQGEDTADLDAASDKAVSEFSLPDVVAELIQRNVMEHPFRNSPEEKAPTNGEKIYENGNAGKSSGNGSEVSTSSGSINLEADFRRVGLRWAANMLEKTHEHQQMSSSDSSTQLNFITPNLRTLNIPMEENSFVDPNIATSPPKVFAQAEESQSTGKPLNLLEFLNRELEKKSLSSIDGSSLTNTRIKSLLDSDSVFELSSKENLIQRTSTPVTGSKMIRSKDKNFKNSSSLTISTDSKLSSIDSVKE